MEFVEDNKNILYGFLRQSISDLLVGAYYSTDVSKIKDKNTLMVNGIILTTADLDYLFKDRLKQIYDQFLEIEKKVQISGAANGSGQDVFKDLNQEEVKIYELGTKSIVMLLAYTFIKEIDVNKFAVLEQEKSFDVNTYLYKIGVDSNKWEYNKDKLFPDKGVPFYLPHGFTIPNVTIRQIFKLSKSIIPHDWLESPFVKKVLNMWSHHVFNNVDIATVFSHLYLPYCKPLGLLTDDEICNVPLNVIYKHASLICEFLNRIVKDKGLNGFRFVRNQLSESVVLPKGHSKPQGKGELKIQDAIDVNSREFQEGMKRYVEASLRKPKLDWTDFTWNEDLQMIFPKVSKEMWNAFPLKKKKWTFEQLNTPEAIQQFNNIQRQALIRAFINMQVNERKLALDKISEEKTKLIEQNRKERQELSKKRVEEAKNAKQQQRKMNNKNRSRINKIQLEAVNEAGHIGTDANKLVMPTVFKNKNKTKNKQAIKELNTIIRDQSRDTQIQKEVDSKVDKFKDVEEDSNEIKETNEINATASKYEEQMQIIDDLNMANFENLLNSYDESKQDNDNEIKESSNEDLASVNDIDAQTTKKPIFNVESQDDSVGSDDEITKKKLDEIQQQLLEEEQKQSKVQFKVMDPSEVKMVGKKLGKKGANSKKSGKKKKDITHDVVNEDNHSIEGILLSYLNPIAGAMTIEEQYEKNKNWVQKKIKEDKEFAQQMEKLGETEAGKVYAMTVKNEEANSAEISSQLGIKPDNQSTYLKDSFLAAKSALNIFDDIINGFDGGIGIGVADGIRKKRKNIMRAALRKKKRKASEKTINQIAKETLKLNELNAKEQNSQIPKKVVFNVSDIQRVDPFIFKFEYTGLEGDKKTFDYNVLDPIKVLDEAIDEAAKYDTSLYLPYRLAKKKLFTKLQAGIQNYGVDKVDVGTRIKQRKRVKDEKNKIKRGRLYDQIMHHEHNTKIDFKVANVPKSVRVQTYKKQARFYSQTGNVTESSLDVNMRLNKTEMPPNFWNSSTNGVWMIRQQKEQGTAYVVLNQLNNLGLKTNMPNVPINAKDKLKYTRDPEASKNRDMILWPKFCETIDQILQKTKNITRFKPNSLASTEVEFITPYTVALFKTLSQITEQDACSIQILDSEMVTETLNKIKIRVVYPDQTDEVEVENSVVNYIPRYLNSNFKVVRYAFSQFAETQNADANPLKLKRQYLDDQFLKITNCLKQNKIYTGSPIGQLARYYRCVGLRDSTTLAGEQMLKDMINTRFTCTNVNLELLGNANLLLYAAMDPYIVEIQTKSSSGIDYEDQRKSLVTTLADVMNTVNALKKSIIPPSWYYYEFKPKFELRDVDKMYSDVRTIFVPQSASQLLANVVYAGTYDVMHYDEEYILDQDQWESFCEPNLLGITQQSFLKQLINTSKNLNDTKIIWVFSDNIYTLVNKKFTSYDGKKMESQIKKEYVKWVGEVLIQRYLEEAKKKFLVDTFDPDGIIDQVFFEKEGKLYAKESLLDKLLPTLINYSRFVQGGDIKMPLEQFVNMLASYKIWSKMKGDFPVSEFFNVEKHDQYWLVERKGDINVPDYIKFYLTTVLPELFEKGQALLITTMLPLNFLPSGWRLTSYLNTVLSMSAVDHFYDLVEQGRENEFEENLLKGVYSEISFTKEAVVEDISNLKDGYNDFDFLGYGVVHEKMATEFEEGKVEEVYYDYVCLRHSSLLTGPFWYSPETFSKNPLVNWCAALAKFISALFNGGVFIPVLLNAFVSMAKTIKSKSPGEVVRLYKNHLDNTLHNTVISSIMQGSKLSSIVESAYKFAVIGDPPHRPKLIEDAMKILEDVKFEFVETISAMTKVQNEIAVFENKVAPKNRAKYLRTCLLFGMDPIYQNKLPEEQLAFWMHYYVNKKYTIDSLLDAPEAGDFPQDTVEGVVKYLESLLSKYEIKDGVAVQK